jgi:hypothetical protein
VFQTLFPIPGVRDYTCCFRAYRVPLLRRARLAYGERLVEARGFEAVMDLLLKLRPLGLRAVEVPFVLDYGARAGQSKMKVLRTVRTTLALLARRWIQGFGPLSPRAVAATIAASDALQHAPPRVARSQAGDRAARADVSSDTSERAATEPAEHAGRPRRRPQ